MEYVRKFAAWEALERIALVVQSVPGQVVLPVMATNLRNGFCIFIHTLCQGRVPSVHESKADDPPGAPERICVFDTEREAQLEIADCMMTRLQEFMDGERDFEDATTLEEYVVAVTVHPDGTITDEDGRRFGSQVE